MIDQSVHAQFSAANDSADCEHHRHRKNSFGPNDFSA